MKQPTPSVVASAAPPPPPPPSSEPQPPDPLALSVATAIARLRREAGLSERAAARRLGTSQTQLRRMEDPRYLPSLRSLARVASVYGYRIDVTFGPLAEKKTVATAPPRKRPVSEPKAQRAAPRKGRPRSVPKGLGARR